MSDSPTSFYQQKTDAELLYFVEHPEHYQPALVDGARRELRRRGVQVAAPAAPLPQNLEAPHELARTGPKTGLLAALVGAVLVVSLVAAYFIKQENHPAPAATTAPTAPRKAPPRLTEVATSVIPDFGPAVLRSVQEQVQHIPAAERAAAAKAGMPLHQYRELAKRFWTAETQTEYVFEQARLGKLDAALPGHVQAVGASWELWNKAMRYGFKFSPAMASHLDIMSRVARQQQEGLGDLLIVANNPQAYENDNTRKRTADVSDLLSGLLPKSPVTGRPYSTILKHVRM
ncbi:hypothetical protein [Hymenobacter terricola]|uniref:hypothetical protein n=1 Tax=Hymenobacter terricola TaxID=2819236 RepID=UPI001B3160DD|nr:hypothetical protein [Hymenobacter terricola]